uniref:Uncharacterized protein n=1 Tax=Arundo donax TaxID=35708 RepID=A0A0A9CEL1_ARUDO
MLPLCPSCLTVLVKQHDMFLVESIEPWIPESDDKLVDKSDQMNKSSGSK